MAIPREINCKSALSDSKITRYTLNCYTGCLHGCVYCYARFMKKFTGHTEPWGEFVDIKINAPEVLAKEVKRKAVDEVFVSSVCDGWQPIENRYNLTRTCLKILSDHGFPLSILTKSALVVRDYDILADSEKLELGFTFTTMDDDLRKHIEPRASSVENRLKALKQAQERNLRTYVFLGPLIPFLSDTEESLNKSFAILSSLNLSYIYVDKLNLRYGVWPSMLATLKVLSPSLISLYRRIFFNPLDSENYCQDLRLRVGQIAESYSLLNKLNIVF